MASCYFKADDVIKGGHRSVRQITVAADAAETIAFGRTGMLSEVVHEVPTRPRGELTAEVSEPSSSRPVQLHTTAVARRRATTGKDPLGALATLIAEALTEKLADTDGARVLRKLVAVRAAEPPVVLPVGPAAHVLHEAGGVRPKSRMKSREADL